ncbi:MAG: hypothetical protein H3C48_20845, partial [Chitinophagaceae bacterium]|nr:hypothetical protein [Chitinophagaceae bacterium]
MLAASFKKRYHGIKFRRIYIFYLFVFAACHPSEKRDSLIISDYRIFYDGQDSGYNTIGGHFIFKEDGELAGTFTGEKFGDVDSDYSTGKEPFLVRSNDTGRTWSKPELFAPQLLINPEERGKEALWMSVFGPTDKGTLLAIGGQYTEGQKSSGMLADPQWRDVMLIIGRKEVASEKWDYTRYPSGTFLGEQWMEGGLQLA